MNKICSLLLLLAFTGTVECSSGQNLNYNYWDGQLYLKLENSATFTLPDYDSRHPSYYPEAYRTLFEKYGVYSLHKAFPVLKSVELQHSYKIFFHDAAHIDELIKALEKIPGVEYAEKVPVRRTCLTPNDPLIGNQYALSNIQAYNAWDLSTGSVDVKIAIVDDEVRLSHADLNANEWYNPNEIPGDSIDNDANGYVDDVHGYDVADGDPDPSPPPTATNSFQTHGTHCAGIADAVSNNSTGIASIGFGLSLIGVKCNPDTITDPQLIYYAMEGVQYAIAVNADVVSMSWGGDGYSVTEQNVFNLGWSQGMIFVAAAGNNSSSQIFYPAGYNHIVSVGSTDNGDALSGFSDFGTWVTVMAPGSSIYSTKAGSNTSYGNLSGTSMATPMVAGLCGLIKAYNSSLTNAQVISCLQSSCDNIDAQNPGYQFQLGAGRINAYAALQCASPIALPVAQFDALDPVNCTGVVSFTDHSTSNPVQWHWNFGDGDSSTLQNPVHRYLASGMYSVTLTVSNVNGLDSTSQSNYVTVNLPSPPVTTPDTVCSGIHVSLQATGTDSLYWFAVPAGGTHLFSGSNYPAAPLSSDTAFYIESDVYASVQSGGPADNSIGGGGYFTGTNYHNLIFDCYAPATLFSVTVYAQDSGFRKILLIRNGVTIASKRVNLQAGMQVVPLNFSLPAAVNLELGMQDTAGLYRNNSGTSFPYTIPGVLSIKGTNAGNTSFYYYFYNWQVQPSPCVSPRVPMPVTVIPNAVAAFSSNLVSDTISFIDLSANAIGLLWNFGDPSTGANDTSTVGNATHIFSSEGNFNVCLVAVAVSGCSDTVCQTMLITSDREVTGDMKGLSVYPNPADKSVIVSFNLTQPADIRIELFNELGQTVYAPGTLQLSSGISRMEIPVDNLAAGIYELSARSGTSLLHEKIVITR